MLVNIKTIRAIFTTNSLARFQTGIKKKSNFQNRLYIFCQNIQKCPFTC